MTETQGKGKNKGKCVSVF